jgi:thiol peroxidase
MAKIHLSNLEMETYGQLPTIGTPAPEFILTQYDMMPVGLSDYDGKKVVINVFPSIDTGLCFASVKKMFEMNQTLQADDAAFICVSMDLPYALQRQKGSDFFSSVQLLSDFRDHQFGADYGVLISSGPLTGLLARAFFIIDEQKTIQYAEMSSDLNKPCQYQKVLELLA